MQIYLPIAELSVDAFLLLGLGGAVGFLSGLFGIGGGFLMTPLLIFNGIPPPVAVATEANQVVAASVSGVLAHWRRGTVDFKMGLVLLAGGILGSVFGVWLFGVLKSLGQIELVIQLSYVIFLGVIGGLMAFESTRTLLRARRPGRPRPRIHARQPGWIRALPFRMRFYKSRLYLSPIAPFVVGAFVGLLAALLGIGGGFVMVPAMIYLLGMPTSVVAGTSLFQIIFVTANVTFLQAVNNQTVDIVLAVLLLVGGVIGAQFGARLSHRLRGEQLRGLLALVVLAVCGKMLYELVLTPEDLFSIVSLGPM